MISNPGSSISPTTMLTSIYDTSNKKQDIFQYTDSKVSDKVTAAQVASQISSATSSFVTSSQVDAKIAASNIYNWTVVPFIPFTGSQANLSATHTHTSTSGSYTNTSTFYAIQLPIPIQFGTYSYDIEILTLGMKSYTVTTSSGSKVGSTSCSLTLNTVSPNLGGTTCSIDGIPCSTGYQSSEDVWCNPSITRRIVTKSVTSTSISNVWAYECGFRISANGHTEDASSFTFSTSGNIRSLKTPGTFNWIQVSLTDANTRIPQYDSVSHYETYGVYFMYRAIRG